jgi:hypothetical protein
METPVSHPSAAIEFNSGQTVETSVEEFLALVQEKRNDPEWVKSAQCGRLGYPSEFLKSIEPWDVPGIGGSETDEQKALEFLDRVGGAVWVFDATLLGEDAIQEPIQHLRKKGIRMVAALNWIDRVAESDIADLVNFVEQTYDGTFQSVCPVSAKIPELKDRAYLSTLVRTIQTDLVASSEPDREKRANLAVANAGQQIEWVLEKERGFHSSFVGFVRHIRKNLNERRSFLLSKVPAWVSIADSSGASPVLSALDHSTRRDPGGASINISRNNRR